MQNTPTIQDFFKHFPDDNACLDYLMQLRHGEVLECPKCDKRGKFHRIRRYPAYECAWCGYEIFPMVGTMFYRSHTPLQKWFYALYLFTTTRHGVPAKELQRQLGVSYPTALRIAHKIRVYMGSIDGEPPLQITLRLMRPTSAASVLVSAVAALPESRLCSVSLSATASFTLRSSRMRPASL